MTIDLATIPADRLAMLDTATLFHGLHEGGGGDPDCKHCARELLYEIVTGKHADKTPPGCTVLMTILPRLNDGPWRDDAHRTAVMRPYLRKFLVLDPANDQQRIYAIIDHIYRTALPSMCDVLRLDTYGSALRNLTPIVDCATAKACRDLWGEMLPSALSETARRRGYAAQLAAMAYNAASNVAFDIAIAYNAYDADAASNVVCDISVAYNDAKHLVPCGGELEARQEAWAKAVTMILDRICAIP